MPRRRVTMSDIAASLNVSVSLVSQVLAGKAKEHRISDQLAEEVKLQAGRMGYQVNQVARSLRTGKSGIIGLLVADIANPYFAQMARVVENEAFSLGYQVMVGSSDENPVKLRNLIKVFLSRQVDALVIVPVRNCDRELRPLYRQGFPVVLIDRYCPDISAAAFCGHHQDGGYQLTRHLIKQGYQYPVAFTFDQSLSHNVDRIKGFKKALKVYHLYAEGSPPVVILPEADIGSRLEERLDLVIHAGNDSLFFANHAIALEALRVFRRKGISIPQDIGMVSFDNPESFDLHDPGITCYEQPLAQICSQAVHYVTHSLTGEPPVSTKKNLIKGSLIIRNSTQKK